MDNLTQDWLAALGIAKSIELDVKRLWVQVGVRLAMANLGHAYELEFKESTQGRSVIISVSPATQSYTLIERVEILLSALSHAELWLEGKGQHASLRENSALCARLGCWTDNTLSARERWRLLAILMPIQNLRIAPLEDRLRCAICHLLMATGSIVKSPSGAELHEGCLEFAKHVLMPALREQRAIEAKKRELQGVEHAD